MPVKTVSILLGVYNAEKTLPRTLESLKNQSFSDFEIVVVNDASTDNSRLVLAKYQRLFGPKQLRVLTNQKNLGLTKSLNYGLKNIRSSYTARIDADDWWDPKKLARQLAYLKKNPDCGVLGCWYINVGADKRQQSLKPPSDDAVIRQTITRRNPFAHSCVLFQTDLVKKLGGYDEKVRYGQDYDLWFRCLPKTKLANLPEFLCYRQTGSGISVEKQRQQMIQSLRTQAKYIRLYQLSWINYLAMAEPLLVILTPHWLKKIKRIIWP